MIAFLRGRLIEKGPQALVVDVNGVGYAVSVPLSTFYELPEPGTEVALRVHTVVREDQIALYGFLTALEQRLFDRLITVNGVGPRLALTALSGIEPAGLIEAVRASDIARLSKIPGIGKKTAERIALELKDKLDGGPDTTGAGGAPRAAGRTVRDDVRSALVNLGYNEALAEKALDAVMKDAAEPAVFEQLLRQALQRLAR
ncbi:MAG: Holliday junction branch migration protein RuvA [Vicinamibacteraceae bacterium]|nr:Holliday junction branch migration protein RuvA [Vicinamibacteraceae bacterium]